MYDKTDANGDLLPALVGANAVVNKLTKEEGILLAGNPAIRIKEINIKKMIKHI